MWSCHRSSGWHVQSAVGSRMPWGCAKDYLGGCYQRFFRNLQSGCTAVSAFLCTAQWCFSGWISGLCTSSFSKICLLISQSLIYSLWNLLDDDLGRILLGTDNRVMPLQVLQLLRAPFLEIFMMMPSVQSSGSCFSSNTCMAAKSGWRAWAANSGSALNSSALRVSWPGAFLFLRDLMAAMISSFSGGVVLRSTSSSGSCMSASNGGGDVFRTSLKCSSRLASCSASVVRSRPWLSIIGLSIVPQHLLLTTFVILYTFPCSSQVP